MRTGVRRSVEVTVERPVAEAMKLFTPEGERCWAEGWDPRYPDEDRREGAGTVFITEHGGHRTTWIMVDQAPEMVRYARVTQGLAAGTVAVEVVEADERSTRARVTYDLTALSGAGEGWLDAFAADYERTVGGWTSEIAAALERPVGR